ncbi:MAG: dUTP diphosphatase [Anaplasmataceae bacterium]|nr:dUTP diphosphatase [Anaplasmataceae bacterium]
MDYAKDLNLPKYATLDSACLDLISADEETIIQPQERKLIGTGLKVALPIGSVGYIFARSGLSIKHGIILANSVGVIDADYRGEIKVPLVNISKDSYIINRGDRIAQFMVIAYNQVMLEQYDSINLFTTERNQGGFGSTG